MTRPLSTGDAAARIPHLDGVRGFAVLLVLGFHAPTSRFMPFGWVGVDLFFVLSGYLITGILLATRGLPLYFTNFYARRALRIWPLYYGFLAFTFCVAPFLFPGIGAVEPATLPWFLLYLQNLPFVVGMAGMPALLGMTWSLAIEEQFYLAWPLAIRFAPKRALSVGAILTISLSPVLRWFMMERGASQQIVYWFTMTRLDGLAAGALLALVEPAIRRNAAVAVRWAGLAAVTCLPIAFWMTLVGPGGNKENNDPLINASVYSLLAVGFGGLLCVTLLSRRAAAAFMPGWLRYVGKVSYGVYIYHYALFLIGAELAAKVAARTGLPRGLVNAAKWALLLPLVFLISEASWRWFESPLLRLKSRFQVRPAVVSEQSGPVARAATPEA